MSGLLLFCAGSIVAALSSSILGIIIGRAIQGSGAIAGPIMALVADLTREVHRTKAMAMIGASIGVSFGAAIAAGACTGGIDRVARYFLAHRHPVVTRHPGDCFRGAESRYG